MGAETGMKICDTTDPIHTIQPHEADKVKRKAPPLSRGPTPARPHPRRIAAVHTRG